LSLSYPVRPEYCFYSRAPLFCPL